MPTHWLAHVLSAKVVQLLLNMGPEHIHAVLCGTARGVTVLRDPSHGIKAILKTSLLRMLFDGGAVTLPPGASHGLPRGHDPSCDRPNNLLLHDVRQHVQTLRFGTNSWFLLDEYARSRLATTLAEREVVEPDGIEPTTSCLQSTRSPN